MTSDEIYRLRALNDELVAALRETLQVAQQYAVFNPGTMYAGPFGGQHTEWERVERVKMKARTALKNASEA